VVVPALALRCGAQQAMVCPVRSRSHAVRLANVASQATGGEPLLFIGAAGALEPLAAAGARTAPVIAAEPEPVAAALRQAFAVGVAA
jgi:hypothetical protein